MRHGIAFAILLLLLVTLPNVARADTITDYTVTFTVTAGTVAPTSPVSMVYDNTTNTVISLTVDWNGGSFSLNNLGPLDAFSASIFLAGSGWCATSEPGACPTGLPFTLAMGPFQLIGGTGPFATSDFAGGTYTLTAVPEPSTILLLISGALGLIGVMRRKLRA